jgi:hypothetical protein
MNNEREIRFLRRATGNICRIAARCNISGTRAEEWNDRQKKPTREGVGCDSMKLG